MIRRLLTPLLLVAAPSAAEDEPRQVVDGRADVSVKNPAYPAGKGPVIAFDQAHRNRHGADGSFRPTALVAQNDGYRVSRVVAPVTAAALGGIDLLIVANARVMTMLDGSVPSAFSAAEIAAIHAWVEQQGGALLLIADHMPYGAAADPLAASFGFHFENSFANAPEGGSERFATGNRRLPDSPIARGEAAGRPVSEVWSFTGTVLHAPAGATPVMRLGSGWKVIATTKPWQFKGAPTRASTEADLRGAIMQVGRGRVAMFSEAAMFTAQLVDGKPMGFNARDARQNKQFLLNTLQWLTQAPARAG